MRSRSGRLAVIPALLMTVVTVGLAAEQKTSVPLGHDMKSGWVPDLTAGGSRNDEHDWTLGPTGARGWIFGSKGQTAESRQILVTAVDAGSPSDGILKVNDVILGMDGKLFDSDARKALACAITTAEVKSGALPLIRWRDGQRADIEVKLAVLGSYSATAPYDCEKSKAIFEQGCEVIARRGLKEVSIPNNLNALALLASGKEAYRPMLAAYARTVADFQADGMAAWYYGYANIFLAEYCMATGDKSVLPGIRRLALEAARGQSVVGTWGHKFARPDGNLNGYGCMNQPGISLAVSMVLARQAGVDDPVLDRAIAKSADFLRWFVNKGAVPYGDHQPWPGHEDNGKCSSSAVLFDLLGDREAATFYTRMAAAGYDERERGHTGNFFNMLWAMPGVSRCGQVATGAYMKEQSWYYDLARDWRGGFRYQGNPPGAEEHGKYTSWDSTGAYLLAYALPLRSLYLTGKKPCVVPPLDGKDTADVIAAGRDFFPANGNNGYDQRQTAELLAGLSSWSPAVRKRSAEAMEKREGDFVPTLVTLLQGSDGNGQYGACEALACLGAKSDAAAPLLRALLGSRDPWLQSLACSALARLSGKERQASINELLAMIVRDNPADPRRMAQRYAAIALISPSPGARTPTLLNRSLDGIDRALLYPAFKALLANEDSVTRGTLDWTYAKFTERELAQLLPAIIKSVEKLAPSNEMFGDGVRLAGLDLLSRLGIREGMQLCISVIEPDRWGGGGRFPKCLEYLGRYGSAAKEVLPELRELRTQCLKASRQGTKDERVVALDKYIASISEIHCQYFGPAGRACLDLGC